MTELMNPPISQLRRTPRHLRGRVRPTWADQNAVNLAVEKRLRKRILFLKRAKVENYRPIPKGYFGLAPIGNPGQRWAPTQEDQDKLNG